MAVRCMSKAMVDAAVTPALPLFEPLAVPTSACISGGRITRS